MTKNTTTVTRRLFLKTTAVAGGGLMIGGFAPGVAQPASAAGVLEPNVWVKITADGKARIMLSMLEMGQGVMTAMPMLLAEELDVDWNNVTTEWVGADVRYGNPNFGGSQTTAGSNSTRGMWKLLREAGAGARTMLISAAAKDWGVPESSLTTDKHLGKFQEANGGTLFLDEVGELPLDIQVKLLRALQESEIDPIGAKRSIKVDVRIVSATNRDLSQAVGEGRFREDLFYRLNVFPIEAPSLRERKEDVAALVDHFIRRFNVEEGKTVVGASGDTMAFLTAYDWPGNVRQLENAVYRAIVLADAPYLQPHDFPSISGVAAPPPEALPSDQVTATSPVAAPNGEASTQGGGDAPVRILDGRGHLRTLEEIERDLIQLAIEIYSGHMSEVARRLGIGRSTLYRKVREQGLEEMVKGAEAAA